MKNKNALPKWLITVTPISKTIALIMFILLPFIGFILGVRFCEKGNFNIFDIGVSNCGVPQKQGPTPITEIENKVEKTTKADGTLEVKLTLVGKVENLNITDIDIPYRYKIVLDKPITDKDAISDARGENIPKSEYVLLSKDEKVMNILSNNTNKKVLISGILEWGLAETRHLKVDSIKLL